MIAVFVREREQGRFRGSTAGARASTKGALKDQEEHEGSIGDHRVVLNSIESGVYLFESNLSNLAMRLLTQLSFDPHIATKLELI